MAIQVGAGLQIYQLQQNDLLPKVSMANANHIQTGTFGLWFHEQQDQIELLSCHPIPSI